MQWKPIRYELGELPPINTKSEEVYTREQNTKTVTVNNVEYSTWMKDETLAFECIKKAVGKPKEKPLYGKPSREWRTIVLNPDNWTSEELTSRELLNIVLKKGLIMDIHKHCACINHARKVNLIERVPGKKPYKYRLL